MSLYRCPGCLSEMDESSTDLSCRECGSRYGKEKNVRIFSGGPDNQAALEIYREASSAGWSKALASFSHRKEMSSPRSCADWRFYIPFGEDVRILEYGCGRGDITLLLSKNSGEVHSVTFSKSAAKIVEWRGKEEGFENIFPLVLEAGGKLPFKDESFDVFIADQVLNRPFLYGGEPGNGKARQAFLSEARRVLKKEGILFVGVVNALHRNALVGKIGSLFRKTEREEDGNFLFNVMIAPAGSPKGWYSSFSGYAELLGRAGFSGIRAFAPLPDQVKVKITLPLEGRGVQEYFFRNLVRRNSLSKRLFCSLGVLLLKTGLFPLTVPYYYFIAEK